jgi:hypothetical protein
MRGLAGFVSLAAVGALSAHSQPPKMTLGEILVIAPAAATAPVTPDAHLFQADRGSRKGQYALVSTGAPEGRPPAPSSATTYQLLAPGSVGQLPDVDVLGIHYLNVKPEAREAFERFVARTLHPAVANLRPDLRLLYYKAVRGPGAGSYIALFALTRQSRDRYWPNGADSDELRATFTPVQVHTRELGAYLVEGSALTDPKFAAAVFESREWTDFVLMPR